MDSTIPTVNSIQMAQTQLDYFTFADNNDLEHFFGVPVKEKIEIDAYAVYGYASCSNIIPEWRCQTGGFLKLLSSYEQNQCS
jgi:hypothetical protein